MMMMKKVPLFIYDFFSSLFLLSTRLFEIAEELSVPLLLVLLFCCCHDLFFIWFWFLIVILSSFVINCLFPFSFDVQFAFNAAQKYIYKWQKDSCDATRWLVSDEKFAGETFHRIDLNTQKYPNCRSTFSKKKSSILPLYFNSTRMPFVCVCETNI